MKSPSFDCFFNISHSASISIQLYIFHCLLPLNISIPCQTLSLLTTDLTSYRHFFYKELLATLHLLYLELAIIRLHLLPASGFLYTSLFLQKSPAKIILNLNTTNALIYPLSAQQTAFCCLTLYLVSTLNSWIWKAAF